MRFAALSELIQQIHFLLIGALHKKVKISKKSVSTYRKQSLCVIIFVGIEAPTNLIRVKIKLVFHELQQGVH